MELVNISSKYVALLKSKRSKTKKINGLDENMLKKSFNHSSEYWSRDEKFCLMIRKVYIHMSIWISGRQSYDRRMHFAAS